MNYFCWLLLLGLTSSASLAQPVFRIDSLPPQGVLLDKGWKWHAGDNPAWTKPEFDDTKWEGIDPTTEIAYLPQVQQAEIGWFRLHLMVSPAVLNQSLAVLIGQVGASEIYLNGRRIYRFGVVSAEYAQEQTHHLENHPFALKLDPQATQILAVRYSFNRKNFNLNYLTRGNPCMKLVVEPANLAHADYLTAIQTLSNQQISLISIFLLIGAFSLFLFVLFRTEKFYLYFGLYAWGQSFQVFLQQLVFSQSVTSVISSLLLFSHLCSVVSVLFMLNGFYALYRRPKRALFYSIVLYAVATIPVLLLFYKWGAVFAFCFYLFLNIDTLRLHFQAARRHRPGAWILFTTIFLFYVFFSAFIVLTAIGQHALAYLISSISLYAVPFGLSLFLAGEFARASRSLQERVVEVEALSAQTIAQEQEKQQLLATQNETLEQLVTQRTTELSQSLDHLKSTQTQLIQKEKMASLGELTAGIAHEIQNPLNFVNNFSEVSTELVDELKEGPLQQLPETEKEYAAEILGDLTQNLQKITHHGGRASAIVKGMLEHSRTATGERQPTDLNALAEEYLRLAYQGWRAKDKAFQCALITEFAPDLGKLEVIPQEIGRVLLNLYNNAFYAVQQRQKQTESDGSYVPTVWVSTHRLANAVEIRVKDNGTGIPDSVKSKIFQPFFTTKPTGEGTGLGLSLSYDIVTKGHGGALTVDSEPGQFTEFIITLPFA